MDDKKQRRVGVITWISYFNFGTYLQAYALQTVVRSLGYACSIVSDEKMVRALRKESCWLRKVVSKIYHFLKRDDVCFIYGMRQIEAAYASFKSSYLSVDDDWNSSMDLDQRYDIYVCGSDQIWSPILPKQDYYYAGFTEKKKVAYAPSIGQRDCSEEWSEWVKPLLDRFSHLSVREEEGAALLRRFMDKPVDVVLDPTLLLSSEDWEKLVDVSPEDNSPYVLCYFLTYNQVYLDYVRAFARERGLRVKMFMLDKRYLGYTDESLFAGPIEFLRTIRGASCFFTDSFHGTIFAIHFERRFYTLKRFREQAENNQNSRIENLFSKLGLQDYFLDESGLSVIPTLPGIDYNLVKERMSIERERSLSYLKKSLER